VSHEESLSRLPISTIYDSWTNRFLSWLVPDLTLVDPTSRHGVGSDLTDSPSPSLTHFLPLSTTPHSPNHPLPTSASLSLELAACHLKLAPNPSDLRSTCSRAHALVAALSLFFLLSKIASSSSAFFSSTPLYTCFCSGLSEMGTMISIWRGRISDTDTDTDNDSNGDESSQRFTSQRHQRAPLFALSGGLPLVLVRCPDSPQSSAGWRPLPCSLRLIRISPHLTAPHRTSTQTSP
jgi:hypothetical protein